jgi:magnesium-protoporphyrin O-methyltransferase
MSSCCCHTRSAGKFFSFFARRYRKRFKQKGFEPSQKQLMAGLEQVGYQQARVLEIGCGVGYLHQTLLQQGADIAVGIDLAPKMLSEAKDWADEKGLGDRVDYIEGDFMTLDERIDYADICLLDKVVCCYPDAQGLVQKSLAKTSRVYGLTYPRNRWFIRLATETMACLLWLIRSDFRSYVHDPVQIERWISSHGFEKRFEDQTTMWLSQVYIRVSSHKQ